MLVIKIPEQEVFDENKDSSSNEKGQFVKVGPWTLQLEHSLISISKWESTWEKPFLAKKEKTSQEWSDYIKCMTVTPNVNPMAYNCLTQDDIAKIMDYINAKMTATTFVNDQDDPSNDVITNEIIYYSMIEIGIPAEFEKWHLNRLLTLIRVCNLKRGKQKKMSKADIIARNKKINDERRKKYNTRG